jgi:hypothetical protein
LAILLDTSVTGFAKLSLLAKATSISGTSLPGGNRLSTAIGFERRLCIVGHRRFIGRFSIETFIVATAPPAPAPTPFNKPPFPDANPTTNPVQLYHLGLWFNNPQDAVNAGGPGTVTPFNGEHNAGVQILDTSNFPDDFGPLRHFNPL